MAIKLSDTYPGRSAPPSIDYPLGAFKNCSAPEVLDGTPLDKEWANDKEGFFQGILAEAEITADGQPDKVGASQYLAALKTVIENEAPTPVQATESEAGIAKIATVLSASGFVNNTDIITPARLASAIGVRVGHTFTENDWAPLPGGLIVQWGTTGQVSGSSGTISATFPITFPTSVVGLWIQSEKSSSGPTGEQGFGARTNSGFLVTTANNVTTAFNWFAIGF